jgi:hypothetical protein
VPPTVCNSCPLSLVGDIGVIQKPNEIWEVLAMLSKKRGLYFKPLRNKAKAISAKLLELNLKNKLE